MSTPADTARTDQIFAAMSDRAAHFIPAVRERLRSASPEQTFVDVSRFLFTQLHPVDVSLLASALVIRCAQER